MSQSFLNSGTLVILCTRVLLLCVLCVVVCKRGGEVSLYVLCEEVFTIVYIAIHGCMLVGGGGCYSYIRLGCSIAQLV